LTKIKKGSRNRNFDALEQSSELESVFVKKAKSFSLSSGKPKKQAKNYRRSLKK
jgi:hypothetical protein